MRISDWSSDVCSSDLRNVLRAGPAVLFDEFRVACKAAAGQHHGLVRAQHTCVIGLRYFDSADPPFFVAHQAARAAGRQGVVSGTSYAVSVDSDCRRLLKKKTTETRHIDTWNDS